jgi:hypothetical protein
MKPPIVIIEGNDISVHPSIEHVASYLEPQDVEAGIFAVYDSEGWLLDLTVKVAKRERQFLWFRWIETYPGIAVSTHEPAFNSSIELRRTLIHYLNVVTKKQLSESDIPGLSLDELIQLAGKYMPWHVSDPAP